MMMKKETAGCDYDDVDAIEDEDDNDSLYKLKSLHSLLGVQPYAYKCINYDDGNENDNDDNDGGGGGGGHDGSGGSGAQIMITKTH